MVFVDDLDLFFIYLPHRLPRRAAGGNVFVCWSEAWWSGRRVKLKGGSLIHLFEHFVKDVFLTSSLPMMHRFALVADHVGE